MYGSKLGPLTGGNFFSLAIDFLCGFYYLRDFSLQVSVTNDDRTMIRHMMRQIEDKTCIKFEEKSSEKPPAGKPS